MPLSAIAKVQFLKALSSRSFALLWLGQTISSLGDGAFATALAWQVLLLTNSATAMGLVVTAEMIPQILFLLLGGVAADRLPRVVVMLLSDSSRAIVMALIAILGFFHLLQLWHLILLALFFGFVSGFFQPASQSILPQLVAKDVLASANALTSLSRQLNLLLGPLLGASLIAFMGPHGAFAFDSLTFVISIFFLLSVRKSIPTKGKRVQSSYEDKEEKYVNEQKQFQGKMTNMKKILVDIVEGFHYVSTSTWLWVSILLAAFINIGLTGSLNVAMPKLVHDVYKTGAWLLGTLATASAVGSLIATFSIGQIHKLHYRGLILYFSLAICSIGLMLFGLSLPLFIEPFIAIFADILIGFGIGVNSIIWITLIQEFVPDDKLGRVSSIDMLGSFCVMPVGYVITGVLTDRIGPRTIFEASSIINLALIIVAFLIPSIRNID